MNRRTQATVLAAVLLVLLAAALVLQPSAWVVYSPGPTLNVLGTYDGKPIVDVRDHPEYRDKGQLRMLTVITSGPDERVGLVRMLEAWIDPHRAVYPRDLIYGKTDTSKSVRQQARADMTDSQDNARAAGLLAAGVAVPRWVTVGQVSKDGAAAGHLRAGDRLLSVDGHPVATTPQLLRLMSRVRPGQKVSIAIRRRATDRTFVLKTREAKDGTHRALIGILPAQRVKIPFPVTFNLSDRIGGPSAGLMFAITVYDLLTKGSLTHGQEIAGTGEIDPEGHVGPIGGVQQKIAAAQRDGARLFLVPKDNCAEAMAASYDADRMRLVRADTVEQAIQQIQKWATDPHASLTECPR